MKITRNPNLFLNIENKSSKALIKLSQSPVAYDQKLEPFYRNYKSSINSFNPITWKFVAKNFPNQAN